MANDTDPEGLTKRLLSAVPNWLLVVCGSILLVFLTAVMMMAIPSPRLDALLGIESKSEVEIFVENYNELGAVMNEKPAAKQFDPAELKQQIIILTKQARERDKKLRDQDAINKLLLEQTHPEKKR